MCVIIHRQPGITIPFEKLKSACIVNADGMGLVAFDRGKFEVRKVFDEAGNDPDVLAKYLDNTKDIDVYVHLRYRTKGDTNKDNVHPFGVLKQKVHGFDLQFMHNGTLSDFGTKADCDSKHFAKSFLRPLSEKLLKAVDPEILLYDDTYNTILEKYAGKGSIFLLTDSFGNLQIVNKDQGTEFDGWWASNEYSFNRLHRETKTWNEYGGSYGGYSKGFSNDREWIQAPAGAVYNKAKDTDEKKVVSLPSVPATKGNTFNDEVPWKEEGKVKEVAKKATIPPTLPKRERFIDVAEINCLSEVTQLTFEHITELVEEFPEHAILLIADLIKELYDKDMEMDDEAYAEKVA